MKFQSPPPQDDDEEEFDAFVQTQDPVHVEAATWIVRQQTELSAEDAQKLNTWLASDTRHRLAYEAMANTLGRLQALPQSSSQISPHSNRAKIHGCNDAVPLAVTHKKDSLEVSVGSLPYPFHQKPQRSKQWRPIMTAVAIICLAGISWQGWLLLESQPVFEKIYVTERGQLLRTSLPDGSNIILDTATRAEVKLYRNRREMLLTEGQVLLEVESNPSQPFSVSAGHVRIDVVGTRFSVRHTQSGLAPGHTQVAVEKGRVQASSLLTKTLSASSTRSQTPPLVLDAGESVDADTEGNFFLMTKEVTASYPAPWSEGRLNFNDTPLGEALAEFERYGNTKVSVPEPAVALLKVGGSFELHRLDAFLDALPKQLPVRLQRNPNGLTEVVRLPAKGR